MEQKKVAETENQTTNKSNKKKYIIAAIIGVFVVGVLIFYGSVAIYYQSHFLPNTTINGFECSNLEVAPVVQMVDSQILDYKIEVSGRLNEEKEIGVLGEISTQDINLQLMDTLSSVEQLLEQQNEWFWIQAYANKHYSYSLVQGVGFDEEILTSYIEEWDAFQEMIVPRDAYISKYSEETGGYEIIPETVGTQLDMQAAIDAIKEAILAQKTSVNLEESNCYMSASVTADDKTLCDNVNAVNKWLQAEITYDWNGNEVIVGRELLREWISVKDNEPQLDEEAVAEFVNENAREYDTYGKNRRFLTTLGVELTLPSGAFGWKTDREGETEELIQLIYQGSILNKEPLYAHKGMQKGMSDIGNSYVEADMTNQHLYLYYQGNIVLETDFVSGDMDGDCMTPQGVFGLTYKTTNAVLRGADYVTPVFYWMPFHGNYGMHDATWRTEFGGDIYLTDGSHGCLNLPLDKAEAIYGYVSTGFPVICYYY